jgi:hypothetical protein
MTRCGSVVPHLGLKVELRSLPFAAGAGVNPREPGSPVGDREKS